jgi:hypothetical protein
MPAGNRAHRDAPAVAETVHDRPRRDAPRDRPLAENATRSFAGLDFRWRRYRTRRKISSRASRRSRDRERPHDDVSDSGAPQRLRSAALKTMPQMSGEGAARRTRRGLRPAPPARSMRKGIALATRLSPSASSSETEVRSICRSNCATTSRGSTLSASARPARCNCSTSAGGGARSASSAVRPRNSRSRCSPRHFTCRARSAPFADVRLGERARRRPRSRNFSTRSCR